MLAYYHLCGYDANVETDAHHTASHGSVQSVVTEEAELEMLSCNGA